MEELSIEEVKQVELELLKNVDEFCRQNKITYFIHGGTLLGAVRHKGFIPWDDDIDISMPRKDYEKFKLLTKEQECPFDYNCFEYDNTHIYAFAKVYDRHTILKEISYGNSAGGIYIDVFPLDNLPNNKEKAYSYVKKSHMLTKFALWSNEQKMLKSGTRKATFVKSLFYPFVKLFGTKYWIRYLIKKSKKYDGIESKYISNIVSPNYINVYEKSWFEETVRLPFENIEVNAPLGYKELLTTMYGDYMQLPPEEKRVTHHDFIVYKK